jgi:hypothetical protein
MGITVDSNVINAYLHCMINDETTDVVYRLIECISSGPGFSIDEDGKMMHQWNETCNNKLFEVWFAEGIQTGIIQAVEHMLSEQHKKHLRIKLGFPYQERHEGVYIEVAAVTPEKLLISEDIDFWSPTDKGSTPERRRQIMEGGQGAVCRYLRNKIGVCVLTVDLALRQLTTQQDGAMLECDLDVTRGNGP